MTSYLYDCLKDTIQELMAKNDGKFVLKNGAVNVLIDRVVFNDETGSIACYEQDKLWICLDYSRIDYVVEKNILTFWLT